MDDQFDEEDRRIMELPHVETLEEEDLNLLRDFIDMMDKVSIDTEVNAGHLRKVFVWLGMDEDIDWNDIMEGTHPNLEELASVLNQRPPSQKGSLSNDYLLNTLPGHSDSFLTNTDMESASAEEQGESTSEVQSERKKQSDKRTPRTRRILDFHVDDDCNKIVATSKEAINTRLRTTKEKESPTSKQDTESSGDETQEFPESESSPQRQKVDPTDDETQDLAGNTSLPQRIRFDQDDEETQDSAENTSPSQRKRGSQSDDETQDSESWSVRQRRKVDDLCRDSKRIVKDLTVANRKFKEIIKDPYHKDDSDDEVESAAESSRTEKRRKFLAPQKNAQQVAWDESDSDSSGDDTEEKLRTGSSIKIKQRTAKCVWSQDEMDFIRDGVRMFGIGDWAAIRDNYPFQTVHRNSVKIKDKYRNMVKNGMIEVEKKKKKSK